MKNSRTVKADQNKLQNKKQIKMRKLFRIGFLPTYFTFQTNIIIYLIYIFIEYVWRNLLYSNIVLVLYILY